MFVYNFKFLPSKKTAFIFASAAVAFAIICVICMVSVQNSLPNTATCDELGTYSLKCSADDEKCPFLNQFGLTSQRIADIRKVKIPNEFNDTYENYNNLQKKIGLNLEKFKGKTADKVTYQLNGKKAKYAVLLIYKGKVIGGHLTNGEYGSENLPLI